MADISADTPAAAAAASPAADASSAAVASPAAAAMAAPTPSPAASSTGKRPLQQAVLSKPDCLLPTAYRRLSNAAPVESTSSRGTSSAAGVLIVSTAASPAAASPSCDELIAAAPKLIAAIRSAAKCVKVAEKVASLLEEGRVKPSNAGALFQILSAAAEEPTRWRTLSMRPAFRRLFGAADARLVLFALPQQQAIKVCRLTLHWDCTAIALQLHCNRTATALQLHCSCTAAARRCN